MDTSHRRWLIVALLGVQGTVASAENAVPNVRVFPEKQRKDMLKTYWKRMSKERPVQSASLSEWRKRRVFLRKQVMDGFGLDPLPPKVPLNLTYGKRIERDDCTISRVDFQTFPGLYATAFLYMPKGATFPAPAVLHPHGHWANWSADKIVQSRCLGLARRGYVSLVVQYEHFEDLAAGLPMRGVFLWNNIRALDVLASLKQVDKTRIGVTGASGGGMQTTDVAAVDPRVRCAAMVAYTTYYHRVCYFHVFGCCYYSPLGAMRYMDQHHLLAMIAPTPLAVFTLTGDWTAQSIDHELKEVAAVYNLFPDRPGPKVNNVAGPKPYRLLTSRNGRFLAERWKGPHDYTQAMRERMYWWMDWWLKGKHDPKPTPEGDLKLTPLRNPCSGPPLAGQAHRWSHRNLAAIVRRWLRFKPPALRSRAEGGAYTRKLRATLTDMLGAKDVAVPKTVASRSLGTENVAGWHVEKLWYESEPGVRIPALLIKRPGGTPRVRKVAVVASANGKNDVFVEPLRSRCRATLKRGRAVLAIDQRLRGEWAFKVSPAGQVPVLAWQGNVRVWGRPELGMAAHDIRAGIAYLATRKDCSPESLQVVGSGHTAGFAALLAGALDQRVRECVADLNHSDFSHGVSDVRNVQTAPGYLKRAPVLHRMLRHGDVGEVATLIAPRKLTLLNANPRTSFNTVEAAYRLLGAAKKLSIQRRDEGADREATVVNGGFEQGTTGWTRKDGSSPTLCTERVDLGKAALQLGPKQVVTGQPIAVEPLTEYRLVLHAAKPPRSRLDVSLLRGGKPFRLVADRADRMQLEECEYEFVTRPGEKSVQIVLSASGDKPDAGAVLIDTIRLVADGRVDPPKPDGKELLGATGVETLALGATIPKRRTPGNLCIPYGPGSVSKVVAEGKDGKRVLYLKNGPGTYVALASPTREPLQRGGLYRFELKARGKGTLDMCFWGIPSHLSPRLNRADLGKQWRTYALDFFVESNRQRGALPTVGMTGEMWVERMSLKIVEPAK